MVIREKSLYTFCLCPPAFQLQEMAALIIDEQPEERKP
jgi:hypothetical protein